MSDGNFDVYGEPNQNLLINGKNDIERFLEEIDISTSVSEELNGKAPEDYKIIGVISLPHKNKEEYGRLVVSGEEVKAYLSGELYHQDEHICELEGTYTTSSYDVFPHEFK